jgi:MATE family multidrug resistance protein
MQRSLSNFLDSSFIIIDLAMLGRLGKGDLAAGSVALIVYNFIWVFQETAIMTLEKIGKINFKRKSSFEMRLWLYVTLSALQFFNLLTVIILLLYPFFGERLFSKNYSSYIKSIQFVYLLIPSVFLESFQKAISRFLHIQGITSPVQLILGLGALMNAFFNYLLMYQSGLGFIGCPVSTIITRALMLLFTVIYVMSRKSFTE